MQALRLTRFAGILLIYSLCIFVTSRFASSTAVKGRSASSKATAVGSIYQPEDFIIVINTEQARLRLALASRPLRTGLRTFIAIDNATLADELNKAGSEYNETYAYFPNRNVSGPERSKPGDTRWQAAPFMAHHHYGPTYKWMLLGDDDTLWFMLGVKRLLYGYDHNMPYAISDHFGDHNARGFIVPSPLAAVCSPCHWPELLRAHHREDLMPYSSAVLTQQEAASWYPWELDGWGHGQLRRVRKRASANATTAAAAATGPRPRRRRAAAVDGGNSTQQQQQQQQPPLWGKKGQVPINMSQMLDIAYYSTAPAFPAAAASGRLAAIVAANAARAGGPAALAKIPPPIPPPGCPCRPSGGCLHRARVCRGRGRGQELCGNSLVYKIAFRGNRTWCRYSWAHGGAGVVLSLGMLNATAGGPAEACSRTTQIHSCDMNLAMCLMMAAGPSGSGAAATDPWVAGGTGGGNDTAAGGNTIDGDPWVSGVGSGGGGGFMFTHPGNAALRGANWADPRFIVFDNPVYQRVLHDPVGFLEGRVTCGRHDREAATAVVTALAVREGPEESEEEEEDEAAAEGGREEVDEGDSDDDRGAAAENAAGATEREDGDGGRGEAAGTGGKRMLRVKDEDGAGSRRAGVGGGRNAGRRLVAVTESAVGEGGQERYEDEYDQKYEHGGEGQGEVEDRTGEPSRLRALLVAGGASSRNGVGSGGTGRHKLGEMGSGSGAGPRSAAAAAAAAGGVKADVEYYDDSSFVAPLEGTRARALRETRRRSGAGGGGGGGRGGSRGGGGGMAVSQTAKRGTDDAVSGGGKLPGGGGSGGGQRRSDGTPDLQDDLAICGWLVRHAVSLHMHGRSYVTYDDAAKAMEAVVRRHLRGVRMLRELQQKQQHVQ